MDNFESLIPKNAPVPERAQKVPPADRKKSESRFAALKQEARPWLLVWKELAAQMRPTRGFFEGRNPNDGQKVDHKVLLDNTPVRAIRTLAAGFTSGLSSPSRPWFKLGLADLDAMEVSENREWLETAGMRMAAVFAGSNIYGVLHSIYEEIAVFGTAAAIVVSDFKTVIRARLFTAGEYYLGTDSDGRVNAFAREYYMTVGQMEEMFGADKLCRTTRALFDDNKVDKHIKVFHLIEKNPNYSDERADNQSMAYSSCYWEQGSGVEKGFLRVSGFNSMPVLAPRWDTTTSAFTYGYGPGHDGLGDCKMLQKLQAEKLMALALMNKPPLQADATVQGVPNMMPGGVTRSSSVAPNTGVRASYQVQPDLSNMDATINQSQRAIIANFYADLFAMLMQQDQRAMTAREVVERHSERLLLLGPVLERLESELLDPLIARAFEIMLEAGLIPEPPEGLRDADIKITYISILAQAQKMVALTGIEQAVAFTAHAAAIDPEAADASDMVEAVEAYNDLIGAPPKFSRSKEKQAERKAARAEAQAAAQQQAGIAQAAETAKTLGDTQLGGNSALDALLGPTGPK